MPQLELAPIGNCAVASLIDARARHVWFCFPRLDGDPIFNSLLNNDDSANGFMDVCVEGFESSSRSYVRNTAILETMLRTQAGEELRIIDFAPRFERYGRSFRPPMIVRRIEPVSGRPRICVRIRPTFDYGASKPQISIGSNHVRFIGSRNVVRVTADIGPSYYLNQSEFLLDRPVSLFIGADESINEDPERIVQTLPPRNPELLERLGTRACHPLRLAGRGDPRRHHPEAVQLRRYRRHRRGADHVDARSARHAAQLGLSLLLAARRLLHRECAQSPERHAHHGGFRALPGGCRRSQRDKASPALSHRTRGDLNERIAEALAGYRGMGPVRIGNAAATQRQNDGYGSIIMSAAQMFYDPRASPGDLALYQLLAHRGRGANAALVPDAGLWEYRDRAGLTPIPRRCAGRRCTGLASLPSGSAEPRSDSLAARRRAPEGNPARAVTGEGWMSGALDGEVVDASSLVLPEIGLMPATDEAFLKTVDGAEAPQERLRAALRRRRRFRRARRRLPGLHLLVHRRAGAASAGRTKRASCSNARSPGAIPSACCRKTSTRDRRAVGQFPADLFAGRAHPLGHAAVAIVGGRPVARLVIVSNRVPPPRTRGSARRAGWRSRCNPASPPARCGSAGAGARHRRDRHGRPRSSKAKA